MPRPEQALIQDIPVVRLSHGPYEADCCPSMGANCIRFAKNGMNVMRTPACLEVFRANPNVYGTPLLFPPNRIANGTYTFQNSTYHLPINEPARGHFIHGFLSSTAFAVVSSSADEAAFTADFHEDQPYPFFPHAFSVTMAYRLHDNGLTQTLSVTNRSDMDMPLGIGFHNAFALPFLPDTLPNDYRLFASVGREIRLDPQTILPTGAYLAESPVGDTLRNGSLRPAQGALSNHFEGRSGEIVLLHAPTGTAVHYQPDDKLSFLMLWNGGGSSFICPEPQSWQIDAPNSPLPPEVTGFRTLAPDATACYTNRFHITMDA